MLIDDLQVVQNPGPGKGKPTSKPAARRDLKLMPTRFSIVVLIMAAVAFAVMALGGGEDEKTHQAILTELRALELNNASLQRDVLRARAGLLENYDPLVNSVVALHENVSALRDLFEVPDIARREAIFQQLNDIQSSIDNDENSVETFKTQNALLQNSLNIFSHALTSLHTNKAVHAQMVEDGFDDVGNLMLQYSLRHDAETAGQISSELDTLSPALKASMPAVGLLQMHGRLILNVLPRVTEIIRQLQASDTTNRVQKLQHEYLELYGITNIHSQWSRVFLGSVSILLCVYVVILVDRLRRQTDRLARRLNFEEMSKEVSASFARRGTTREGRAVSMDAALRIVQAFFRGSRIGFTLINPATMAIEQHFGDDIELLGDPARIAELISGTEPASYRNLQRPDALNFAIDAAFSGSALSLRISDKLIILCIIEYLHPKPRPGADEVSLLEASVRVLYQTLDYHCKQNERETLQKRLEHAERLQAVGTLAGGIAHEFNNILVAILGYAEMVLDLLRRRSTTRQYVEEIVKAAERARLIINQILALSRKREYASQPIDLSDIIVDIESLLRVSLPNRVELQIGPVAANSIVEGNPVEIQQILMNLCKNAAEAMNGSGTVSIGVRKSVVPAREIISHGLLPAGDYVVLAVTDNGKGIPEVVLPKIFEPFFTTRAKSGGTGLGLAAVHGNVEALGGYINVVSNAGKGTRFEIFLPRSDAKAVPLRQFFDEERVPLGRGETVAILDADKTSLTFYEDQLAALGYEPIGFSNWPEFTNWLSKGERAADLALLDETSIAADVKPSDLDQIFGRMPYLLISGHPESLVPETRSLAVVRKPVSSKTMAAAIKTRIQKAMQPE